MKTHSEKKIAFLKGEKKESSNEPSFYLVLSSFSSSYCE